MFDSLSSLGLALLAGISVGLIFAAIRLPIPAPAKLEGVAGIGGIFLGYWLFKLFFQK